MRSSRRFAPQDDVNVDSAIVMLYDVNVDSAIVMLYDVNATSLRAKRGNLKQ